MITFDFNNGSPTSQFNTPSETTVTNIDSGIQFTMSIADGGRAFFPNQNGFLTSAPLWIEKISTPGTFNFTLEVQSTADPDNTLLSGTTGNMVVLNLGTTNNGPGTPFNNPSSGTWDVVFLTQSGAEGTRFDSVTGNQNLSVVGVFSGIRFITSTNSATLNIETLTVNALSCFCAGTLIATPEGDKAVEDLREGDMIRTADGGTTTVHWLGRQKVNSALSNPTRVNPICITAGAIAPNVPTRDLWLSQDHAVEIDGVLYNAGTLTNGTTIYQVARMPAEFTYYHVETDGHELLLAEELSAETYIDYLVEGNFDNARLARVIREMSLPRVSSARMVPDDIKARLGIRKQVKTSNATVAA